MVVALIITYNPNVSKLIESIGTLKNQTDKIIVVDNGSKNQKELYDLLGSKYKVILKVLIKNEGIATAQNIGFRIAEKENAEWVLTMDQDSLFPLNGIESFKNSKEYSNRRTGIIAANYVDSRIGKNLAISEAKVSSKDFVISSGNLVLLKAWKNVQGFDEKLFIDYVDYDFDAKLKKAGYNIFQDNEVIIQHELGMPPKNRPFIKKMLLFRKDSIISDHVAFRQYYFYRNVLIFWKRYPELLESQRKEWRTPYLKFSLFISLRRFFLFKNSTKKLFMALKGIIDGILYNPDKDSDFQKNLIEIERNRF